MVSTLASSVGCSQAFDLDPVAKPDAPRGVALCIADDFELGTIDTARWAVFGPNKGVTLSIDAGRLRYDVPQSTSSTQDPYGVIQSAPFDLTGGSVEAEFVEVPTLVGAKSEVVLEIKYDDQNHYNVVVQPGKVVSRTYDNGVLVDIPAIYDPALHRVLRIRHDTATNEVVFEAHGNGTDRIELRRAPFTFATNTVTVDVVAGSFDVADAFKATIDNVVVYGRCGL